MVVQYGSQHCSIVYHDDTSKQRRDSKSFQYSIRFQNLSLFLNYLSLKLAITVRTEYSSIMKTSFRLQENQRLVSVIGPAIRSGRVPSGLVKRVIKRDWSNGCAHLKVINRELSTESYHVGTSHTHPTSGSTVENIGATFESLLHIWLEFFRRRLVELNKLRWISVCTQWLPVG